MAIGGCMSSPKDTMINGMCFLTEQNMTRSIFLSEHSLNRLSVGFYERHGHKCLFCVANGVDTEYAFEEMQGDHIIP